MPHQLRLVLLVLVLGGVVSAGVAQKPSITQAQVLSTAPALEYAAMAYDAARQQLVVVGRLASDGGSLAHTWTWDGQTWAEQRPATSPPARRNASMAYDAARQQIVLFGGWSTSGMSRSHLLGDTWTWDGQTWTEQTPPMTPPGRFAAGMAYDAVGQQVVLFGGSDGNMPLGDTWTWNGKGWSLQAPTASPTARRSPGMASTAQKVVLFGGADCSGNPCGFFGDTWTWEGRTWTQQAPQTSPPPRSSPGLASGMQQHVVLFGGITLADPSNPAVGADTWIWDGTNWTQQQPAAGPPAHNGLVDSMAFDAGSGLVVSLSASGESWIWDGKTWTSGIIPNGP
jgi:hypothetical protein